MINQDFQKVLMKIENKNNIFRNILIYARTSFSKR